MPHAAVHCSPLSSLLVVVIHERPHLASVCAQRWQRDDSGWLELQAWILAWAGAYCVNISNIAWISSEDGGDQQKLIGSHDRNTYLSICVSVYLHANKITKKTWNNLYTPSENNDPHLKIKVPLGSNAYLRICLFSKEITALINFGNAPLFF